MCPVFLKAQTISAAYEQQRAPSWSKCVQAKDVDLLGSGLHSQWIGKKDVWGNVSYCCLSEY